MHGEYAIIFVKNRIKFVHMRTFTNRVNPISWIFCSHFLQYIYQIKCTHLQPQTRLINYENKLNTLHLGIGMAFFLNLIGFLVHCVNNKMLD